MRNAVLVFAVALAIPGLAEAGEYNDVLKIGAAAPAWQDLPGVDGKKHALTDLKEREVVVVVFLCCSCPAVADYEERILALARKYAGGGKVAVVGINVNTVPEDRLPKMQERAKEKGYTFPYLYDESQKIARQYGAEYTPEFFVLDKGRKVVYMGAMDDRDDPAKVKSHFVEEAVEAALKGQLPATKETLGRGCRIRYNKTRPVKK